MDQWEATCIANGHSTRAEWEDTEKLDKLGFRPAFVGVTAAAQRDQTV